MAKTILVVLTGSNSADQTDHYQLLQEEAARTEASKGGVAVEIVFAPGFHHLGVIRKRLQDSGSSPLDAVVVEPSSVSATALILKELKGRAGLVLLNAWSPEVEQHARGWGEGLPFGTVSTDHKGIGQIQGRQIRAMLPGGGHVLCVTGPQRSSAAVQRLEGLKAVVGTGIGLYDTEAGEWMESDGIVAFDSWYALYRRRDFEVDVVAAQSDELAVGARSACEAVTNGAHRRMLTAARFLGVDACPAFGRKLVDSGRLAASIITPANTGEAIRALRRFWESGQPPDLRRLTQSEPYPDTSVALR
jgi:ABC-type sugar transport system substrate-binding protein